MEILRETSRETFVEIQKTSNVLKIYNGIKKYKSRLTERKPAQLICRDPTGDVFIHPFYLTCMY